jgi:hypothetical protein
MLSSMMWRVGLWKMCHVTHMHVAALTLVRRQWHDEKLRSKLNDLCWTGLLNSQGHASRSYIIQVILAIDPTWSAHKAQSLTRLTRKFIQSRCVWAWKCIGHSQAQSDISSTDSLPRADQADSDLVRLWPPQNSRIEFISQQPGG